MKRLVSFIALAALLTALLCATVLAQRPGEVYLGGYLLLRIRDAAAGYSVNQRVLEIQRRANDLLRSDENIPLITVKKIGNDAIIYTNDILFMTVTPADARANSTTVEGLAMIWADRMRAILPQIIPQKPGVGLPLLPNGEQETP